MQKTFIDSAAAAVLNELYADARENDPAFRQALGRPGGGVRRPASEETPLERYTALKSLYMPIDVEFGNLLYSLVRATRAQTVVEFGTSFGISTIFLAGAVRDNGAGQVITSEFIPEKAATARANLTRAEVVEWVDFRIGDALQTLADPLPGPVDFVFLDGDKTLYLDVLKILEPKLKPGCLIASDNTDHDGLDAFLAYLRDPKNCYLSSAVLTAGGPNSTRGHEVSVRL